MTTLSRLFILIYEFIHARLSTYIWSTLTGTIVVIHLCEIKQIQVNNSTIDGIVNVWVNSHRDLDLLCSQITFVHTRTTYLLKYIGFMHSFVTLNAMRIKNSHCSGQNLLVQIVIIQAEITHWLNWSRCKPLVRITT